jgi:signal transduction histidine kinase
MHDEIGALAQRFNLMAARIQDAQETLEAKVADRTRELARSLEDLRAAQDRLIQTEKLASLGQLTAGIAHEIKNPLNFINNFADLSAELVRELEEALGAGTGQGPALRDEVAELSGMLRDNLARIVQHGRRTDMIVRNMLAHSREGGGELRTVDLNALADDALNLAYHGGRAERPDSNVVLERDFDPAVGRIGMYPQEFTRVLLNLIGNGLHAVHQKQLEGESEGYQPTLRLATSALPDRVEVRVRDNGIGIPEAVRARIFEPFFTTKPAGEGTGLGLSLSHDIVVKQHGGTIQVATEPGHFTEFIVTLPRAVVPAESAT